MIKIVFLALAGLLTFACSAFGFVVLFGMDLTGFQIRDLLLLWPLLAFPVFLLILISLRWAVLAIWLLIFYAWVRCCEFNTSLWIHRLPESPADSALFVAVVLVALSYVISALGGNLPSDGVAGRTRR